MQGIIDDTTPLDASSEVVGVEGKIGGTPPLTFGSLFSGIGGIDLGLERSGMECLWQVEYDEYCNKILAKQWPEVKRYGDITRINKSRLEHVDLICGGFPCQPFSVAGNRKGVKDRRWLWPEFRETIRQVKPKWVLVENVPGLRSIDSGRTFGAILSDLAEMGFDAWWGSLRASDFGARHRRERIVVVGYAEHFGRNASEIRQGTNEGSNRSTTREVETCKSQGPGPGPEHEVVADTDNTGFEEQRIAFADETEYKATECRGKSKGYEEYWQIEPDVGRVADGVPDVVDRIKCLGNAVVPQLAEFVGDIIMACEGVPHTPTTEGGEAQGMSEASDCTVPPPCFYACQKQLPPDASSVNNENTTESQAEQ